MGHRWLLVLALAGCFSSNSGGRATPPSNTAVAPAKTTRDHHAQIADPLGFLPIDSELVLHLDVERMRKSSIWTQYEPKMLEALSQAMKDVKDTCGIESLKQLRSVRVGFKDFGGSAKPHGVLVATGIDGKQLLACIATTNAKQGKLAIDGNVVVGAGTDGEPFALEIVGNSAVVGVIGPGADRARLDEVVNSGSPLRNSEVFSEIFSTINTQSALWFSMNGNAKVFDSARSSGFGFNALFGSIGLVDGLSASVRMRVDSPSAASQMTTMLTGQVGMAKSFVERLDVSADANDVVLELGMTDAQIFAILGMAGLSP